MSSDPFQHAVVAAVALAASATLIRRLFGSFGSVGPGGPQVGCTGCPSARVACGAPASAVGDATVEHPVVLIRRPAGDLSQPLRAPGPDDARGRINLTGPLDSR